MNLGKVEKIIIAVLVIGAIIGFGIFLFIVPSFNKISAAEKRYDTLAAEQQEIYQKLERENTIDNEIKEAKNEAKKLEGSFYPDLTTYEATEIVLAYLKKCNLETNEISVQLLSTEDLELQSYNEIEVSYSLKEYSSNARGTDENALTEGQFKDGNKVYTVSYSGISDIQISDAEGNVIDKAKYTDAMKKAYNKTLCRAAAENETVQTVAVMGLSFDVTGIYKDYLAFLDYVNDLDRATMLRDVTIPITVQINEDEDSDNVYVDEGGNALVGSEANNGETECKDDTPIEDRTVEIVLFCVEPMESLDTLAAGDASIVVNQ